MSGKRAKIIRRAHKDLVVKALEKGFATPLTANKVLRKYARMSVAEKTKFNEGLAKMNYEKA